MNKQHLKNPVFIISAAIVAFLVFIGAIFPNSFGAVAEQLFLFATTNFGWFYLISVFIVILFLIGLAISKFGKIRLGTSGIPIFHLGGHAVFYRIWVWFSVLGSCGANVPFF